MSRASPILLSILAVALLGGGALLLFGTGQEDPPASTADAASQAEPAPRPQEPIAEPVVARQAIAPPGRAAPVDAVAIIVRIVDAATNEPVPGATVLCMHGSAVQQLEQETADPERTILRTDRDRLARRFGWQTASGADGSARVQTGEALVHVIAHRGELYGELEIRRDAPQPHDGYVLPLHEQRVLRVQVVDQTGQGVPGVPLEVKGYDASGRDLRTRLFVDCAFTCTEAPHGIARLRNVADWRNDHDRERPETWRVGIRLPGIDDPGVLFDARDPPREPIVLQLPECGSVRVRVDAFGEPWHNTEQLVLQANLHGSYLATREAPIAADGWATFDRVPIGHRFAGKTHAQQPGLSAEFDGPVYGGQQVDVVLVPGERQCVLSGRAVDTALRPIAEQALTFIERGDRWPVHADVRTDAQGRFLVPGSERGAMSGNYTSVKIEHAREGQPRLQAELTVDPRHNGRLEVGDVVLGPGPLLVAGRFVVDDASLLSTLQLQVQELLEPGQQQPWGSPDIECLLHADARFQCTGTVRTKRCMLVVRRGQNNAPIAIREFTPPTDNLTIEIETGSEVHASLLLPDGATRLVHCALVPRGSAPAPGELLPTDRRIGLPTERAGGCELTWSGVPSGSYDLVVLLPGLDHELHRVANVRVPMAPGADPRLQDIDIRPLVVVLRIDVSYPQGRPPSGVFGALFPVAQTGDVWRGVTWGQERTVAMPARFDQFLLAHRGYRPQVVRPTGSSIAVQLEPWPITDITLQGMPPLLRGVRAIVDATPTGPPRSYRTQHHSGDLRELTGAKALRVEVQAGKAEVPVADEPLALAITLWCQDRTYRIQQMDRATIEPDERSIVVRVPPEEWTRALTAVDGK